MSEKSFAASWSKAQLDLGQQENTLVAADLASVATKFAQGQLANQARRDAAAKVLSLPAPLDDLKYLRFILRGGAAAFLCPPPRNWVRF